MVQSRVVYRVLKRLAGACLVSLLIVTAYVVFGGTNCPGGEHLLRVTQDAFAGTSLDELVLEPVSSETDEAREAEIRLYDSRIVRCPSPDAPGELVVGVNVPAGETLQLDMLMVKAQTRFDPL